MHWILLIMAVACVTVMAVSGLAAVTSAWVMPSQRGWVLRPRLWGTGMLLSAFGLAAFLFLGPLAAVRPVNGYLPLAGMAVNFVGMVLQTLARRRSRVPHLPTKTAS